MTEERKTVLLDSPDVVKPYIHQFMPNLSPEAYESLKEDIRENGILMPLLLDEDYAIVDGHNRVRIWQELVAENADPAPVAAHIIPGLNPHTAHNMAIAVNVKRRNMTPPQKRELVAQELRYLAKYYEDEGYTGDETRSWDSVRLADHCAVSPGLIKDVRRNMEASGEIPKSRYFVRRVKSKQGKWYEAPFDREKQSHGGTDNLTAGNSWPSNDGEESEVTKDKATTLTLSDGNTVEVSEVEDIIAFYREQASADEKAVVLANGTKAIEGRHKGAIQTLRDMGIEVPEMPRGYTREEKVYALLADFRDQLLKMPADPKAVARITEDYPIMAAAAVDDFRELSRWLNIFYRELDAVVSDARKVKANAGE